MPVVGKHKEIATIPKKQRINSLKANGEQWLEMVDTSGSRFQPQRKLDLKNGNWQMNSLLSQKLIWTTNSCAKTIDHGL